MSERIIEIDELLNVLHTPVPLEQRLLTNGRITMAISPFRKHASYIVAQNLAKSNPRKIVTTYRQADGSLSYGTSWAPDWIENPDWSLRFIRESFPHVRLTIHTPSDLEDPEVVTADAFTGRAAMSTFGSTLGQTMAGIALMLCRSRLMERK